MGLPFFVFHDAGMRRFLKFRIFAASTYFVIIIHIMRKKRSILTVICVFFGIMAAVAQCPPETIVPGIPWFEDFESYPLNEAVPLDSCWATPETLVVNNGVSPFVYTGYPYACHSGFNSLEMKQSPVMVVFPEFTNDIRKLTLSLWGNTSAQNANAAGTLTLGVITDISDPTSFIPVDTIPATAFGRTGQDAPYTNFMGEHSFSGVTPQPGMRIALRLTNTQRSWNFDDITITAAPELNADSLPFIATFSENEDWWLNNGDANNHWVIGTTDGSSDSVLFVTHDGHTPGYNIAVASTVMAEKVLIMPAADTIRVDFDVQVGGETHFDFLKVFLVPEEEEFTAGRYNNAQSQSQYGVHALDFTAYKPQNAGSDGYPYIFNLSSGTTHVTAGMANPAPESRAKLVFLWRNDNTTGTQPGAIISHVTVVEGAPCKTPTGLHITDQSNELVTVAWDTNPDVTSWEYRYALVGSNDTVTGTVDTTTFTISTDLESHGGLTYWLQVRSDCGGTNLSNWSDTLTAQILNVGIADRIADGVRVYPNPAQEVINVECRMKNEEWDDVTMEVYDVYGKVVRSVVETCHGTSLQTRINVSGLAEGMYFVRVTTEAGMVTKTFVKR